MDVARRQRELEPGQQERKDNLELDHGEILSCTGPGPDAEGHVHVVGLAGARYATSEPARVETVGVGAPHGRVPVCERDRDPDVGASRDVDATEVDVLQSFPRDEGGRRVEPERLLDHHC